MHHDFGPVWGGGVWPPPGNQRKSAVRPHFAKSYFETYKIHDNMQKIRPITQKFTEILRLSDFLGPWPTKIAVTRSIFEIQA